MDNWKFMLMKEWECYFQQPLPFFVFPMFKIFRLWSKDGLKEQYQLPPPPLNSVVCKSISTVQIFNFWRDVHLIFKCLGRFMLWALTKNRSRLIRYNYNFLMTTPSFIPSWIKKERFQVTWSFLVYISRDN